MSSWKILSIGNVAVLAPSAERMITHEVSALPAKLCIAGSAVRGWRIDARGVVPAKPSITVHPVVRSAAYGTSASTSSPGSSTSSSTRAALSWRSESRLGTTVTG